VCYVLVVISWVVLASKGKRNAKLLANLEKLPEKDRLKALTGEMGSIELKEGFSPEQWIRQRQHFYAFMGFLAALIAAVILVVIAMAQAKGRISDPLNPPPLSQLKLQISRSDSLAGNIEQQLGFLVQQ